MKIFCDTSVLVAACLAEHPRHAPAWSVLLRLKEGQDQGFVAAHSLVEAYSVLTRLPGGNRVPGIMVWELLTQNVLATCGLVALTGREYAARLKQFALAGVEGGRVYDGLILAAAEKAEVDRVYTLNLKHFLELASPTMKNRLASP